MRHQHKGSQREQHRDLRNSRHSGRVDRHEAREGGEDRWQSVGENYNVNRSYVSGREDFGSNSRRAGGWSESIQSRQNFYGKGPKGYKRSDERIKEEIHETLTWNYEIDASDIEVEVKEGEVTLTGTIADRHMKRLAEELIEDISGVRDVTNQLKLKKETAAEKH